MIRLIYFSIAIVLFSSFLLHGCGTTIVKQDDKVKLVCRYMGYACGDCYANYKIKKVSQSTNFEAKLLVGSDLKVLFKAGDEAKLEKVVSKCAICYEFYFEGNISKKKGDTFYTLNADSFSVYLSDSTCCN